jgi:hypothetical protein
MRTLHLARAVSVFICVHLWLDFLFAPTAAARLQSALRFAAAPPIALSVGDDAGPQALGLADVSGDGVLDLLALDRNEEQLAVLHGDGAGGFGAPQFYPLDGTPAALAVADVASLFSSDTIGDIDGYPDVVIAHDDGYAEILLGRADGGFDTSEQDLSDVVAGVELNAVALRALDDNGRLDMILLDAFDEVFFLCNEAGVFAPCITASVCTDGFGAIGLAAGEFSGDRDEDVAVLSRDSNDLRLITSLGGGRFAAEVGVVPLLDEFGDFEATSLALARLDDDGLDDLLIATRPILPDPDAELIEYRNDALLGVLPRAGQAPLLQPYSGPRFIDGLLLADFDADGRADALRRGYYGLELGDGAAGFATPLALSVVPPLPPLRMLVAADVDGDQRLDFVALDADGEAVIVVRNTTPPFCAGDCGQNGAVTIDELLRGVNAALGLAPLGDCGAIDADRSNTVEINELIAAVGRALDGCPAII